MSPEKNQLYHCKQHHSPAHRIDLRGYNCINARKKKLQIVSAYDDVRLYEYTCSVCSAPLRAWRGIGFAGEESPLTQIPPTHFGLWDTWVLYANITDPNGVYSVKGSKYVHPFTLHNVPVMR